jgi:putative DNA primase/helicase
MFVGCFVFLNKCCVEEIMSETVNQLFVKMSRIEPLSVSWAWEGLVPMGKLSLMTGDPGVGKSLVALQVAAMMTRGQTCPPDLTGAEPSLVREGEDAAYPRGVLVLSAADDPQDTVLPRLIAAGADPSLVYFLKGHVAEEPDDELDHELDEFQGPKYRPFQLSQDLDKLTWCLEELSQQEIDVGLIVIDSIDRFIGTTEKKSDRIELVAQLADLAARSQAAVLVTANTSMKAGSRGGTVVYQELLNAARSVLMVAEDLDDSERRLVLPVKHNLTARPETVSFVVQDGVVRWETEPVEISAADYLARRKAKNPLHRADDQEIDRVMMWLKEELGSGPVAAASVQRRASENEISYGTLRRAFKSLEGKATKTQNQWFWSLPVPAVVESAGTAVAVECAEAADQQPAHNQPEAAMLEERPSRLSSNVPPLSVRKESRGAVSERVCGSAK